LITLSKVDGIALRRRCDQSCCLGTVYHEHGLQAMIYELGVHSEIGLHTIIYELGVYTVSMGYTQ